MPKAGFYDHAKFRPWRLQALAFKAIRWFHPTYPIWRDFPYEYEFERLAIDVINGGPSLREWVDNPASGPDDLDRLALADEAQLARGNGAPATLLKRYDPPATAGWNNAFTRS